jgi:hypothetical protein
VADATGVKQIASREYRKVPLSRHRRFPGRRSKTAALIAAGAVTVATATTAAAVTLSSGPSAPLSHSGPAAGRSHELDAGLLADNDQLSLIQAVAQGSASQQRTASQPVEAYVIRDAAAELADAHWAAARKQAAKKTAASRAATARAAAAQSQKSQQSQSQGAQSQGAQAASVTTTASGSAQQIAQGMLASFGWSPSQFSCLEPLWEHESGWSVTASNPGSGAYGIPQALPGSRMASAGPDWQTDAATQIRWGLEYIKDTYGSPCAAWSHEEATGWY